MYNVNGTKCFICGKEPVSYMWKKNSKKVIIMEKDILQETIFYAKQK